MFLLPGKHTTCIGPDGKLATWCTRIEDLRAEVVSPLHSSLICCFMQEIKLLGVGVFYKKKREADVSSHAS